jgi:hypothetical protein
MELTSKSLRNLKMPRTLPCLQLLFVGALFTRTNTSIAQSQWIVPLTEHGQPDLQGVWYFGNNTPFTRPAELGEQKIYTLDEAKNIEQAMGQESIAQDLPLDPNRPASRIGATIGFEADYNFATQRNALTRVNGEYRTSLIIDPANGQIPTREGVNDFHDDRKAKGIVTYDGSEAQNASEGFLSGGWQFPHFTPCYGMLIYK